VYEGRWNPAEREIERDVIPMLKSEGMGLTVWSALGGGKFNVRPKGEKHDGRTYSDDLGGNSVENYQKFAVVMAEVGKKRGTNATGVAMRYVQLKVSLLQTNFSTTSLYLFRHPTPSLSLEEGKWNT
jgi:aryl-alcohol dehydrogenase-like predicted oxidoreductase